MKKAVVIVSIVALIGTAAYFFYKKQIELLQDMEYQFAGIGAGNISLTNTVATLKIKIISKSTLEAEILDLDLDVYINGSYVGKVTEKSKIIIPAKGYSIVELNVQTNPMQAGTDLFGVLPQIVKNKDANMTLKGFAKTKSAVVTVKVPVDYTESIKYLMS